MKKTKTHVSPASVTNSSGNPSCNYYALCFMSLGLLWHSIASSSSILSVNLLPPTFVRTSGFPSHVKSARPQGGVWNNHFIKGALIYATPLSFAESSDKLGLYVHIPYCRRRCHYCNFAIVPIGSTNTTYTDNHFNTNHTNTNFYKINTMYEQTVLKELRLNEEWLSTNKVSYIQSVYFGGGTPSLAPITTLARIMDAIRQAFIIDPNAEITIEMDPGTFDREKLYAIRNRCGFNRVSLGVQSMDEEILKVMGRQHTVQDVYDSMTMLREANITSISIDLICGQVPGLTLSKWVTTLEKAANLYPNHMSVYDLQLERGTIFDKWYKRSSKKYDGINNSNSTMDRHNATKIFPTVEESAFMYKYTSGYLRSRGYEHYEISSYAAPGRKNYNHTNRSQHNSLYWEPNSQWIALGLGSTSCLGNKHYQRPSKMSDYIDLVNSLSLPSSAQDSAIFPPPWCPSQWFPHYSNVKCSFHENQDTLTNIIMTRLRTSDGLDLDWISTHYGEDMAIRILRGVDLAIELNLANIENVGNGLSMRYGILKLVDPEGFLFSNTILSSIFAELGLLG